MAPSFTGNSLPNSDPDPSTKSRASSTPCSARETTGRTLGSRERCQATKCQKEAARYAGKQTMPIALSIATFLRTGIAKEGGGQIQQRSKVPQPKAKAPVFAAPSCASLEKVLNRRPFLHNGLDHLTVHKMDYRLVAEAKRLIPESTLQKRLVLWLCVPSYDGVADRAGVTCRPHLSMYGGCLLPLKNIKTIPSW